MKSSILFLFLFTTITCNAQTKVIGHKSHSGSSTSFSKAYKKSLFDINRSNFGLPGKANILVLDSVIALNDSITVLKMRESRVCYPYFTSYNDLKMSDFKIKNDTLFNHKIFNKKNPIAFIKANGISSFEFSNPIETVKFVGFKE